MYQFIENTNITCSVNLKWLFLETNLIHLGMTKKDFFRIIIKIAGIYWMVTTMYSQLPYLFSSIFSKSDYSLIPYSIGFFLICFALFITLVFYTDKIIRLLKLDSGFDEERIEFSNFNIVNVLKLALIIVGCMLIINNIPTCIVQSYYYIKINLSTNLADSFGYTYQNGYQWVLSVFNLILGYILLTNYPGLSKFILKITQKKEEV